MHRFRDYLYRRYCSLLTDKLHSQRQRQQERVRARPSPNDGIKQKKHKAAFSKLKHDNLYLKDIPKTSYYLIFELQNELVQHGHLQTQHQLEDFYKSIQYNRHPSTLQRSLTDIKMKMLDKRPAIIITTPSGSSQRCTEDTDTASDSRLTERGSESCQRVSEEIFEDSLEKDEFEQLFPKKKMPTFVTLQPNFMRSFQCTLPKLISFEIPKKSRKADMYLKQVKDMHALCLTNMKFSQSFKLLDRKMDSESWLEGENQKIPDLTLPDIDSHKKSAQSPTISQQLNVHSNPPPSAQDKFDQVEEKVQSLESELLDSAELHSTSPVPLCFKDLYGQKHVKVIGCGLKLWKNYTVVSE
ncbi:uncharacterized protein si:ch211-130h14.4 isoform X2 [Boleophthalmus pectinirostris]|uniref:uncharacterized protein si:ch211-130h14.4 isoform X2 n=1 Tax=Boleophthalmus pectinirostris TaxID=150288 RepID=UPI00242D3FDA|nr:uncharacterized protein si:ch211-130h14.4 isoform X2 [Boleophthalmus pectinirostris]